MATATATGSAANFAAKPADKSVLYTGVDSSATPQNIRDFDRRVRIIRTALGGLSPQTAKKIATENLHKLFRLL